VGKYIVIKAYMNS